MGAAGATRVAATSRDGTIWSISCGRKQAGTQTFEVKYRINGWKSDVKKLFYQVFHEFSV
jgi:hypothetical protein